MKAQVQFRSTYQKPGDELWVVIGEYEVNDREEKNRLYQQVSSLSGEVRFVEIGQVLAQLQVPPKRASDDCHTYSYRD